MARPFGKLRGLLKEYDLDQKDFARMLYISETALSRRMSGRGDWLLSEIWQAMEILHIPANKMHEYFPKQGINEPGVIRPKGARAS